MDTYNLYLIFTSSNKRITHITFLKRFIMKYPQQQFELLKRGLKVLADHFEIKEINPCQLQYLLYQQASEGQRHNALFINEKGQIVKGFIAKDLGLEGFVLLVDFLTEANFPLYPEGCNDIHVETAVKAALKTIPA